MTDEELDAEYREMIDIFIDKANELAKQSNIENISMALLHAASRFNAYVVSNHAETLNDYENELDKARTFFISNYNAMLDENLQDYKKKYNEEFKYLHLMN